ncbi:MAG TPA: SRPBCC family protein [Trebonia sp.]|nr:SRPBCC family protein [Trebonia sp.]
MAIELDNSFTVPVPPEQAWDVLLDVERIAPCMPGASVLSVDGDSIEGQVKVKLGPLSLTYKGTAKFVEKDEATRTIVLDASGKETRGAGTASASVNAVLKSGEEPGTTTATIHTSLNVTGRPAQFGRSLLPEISGKLIAQFADNLAALISADGAATAPQAAAPATTDAATTSDAPAPTDAPVATDATVTSTPAATSTPAVAGTPTAAKSATDTPATGEAAPKPAPPAIKQEESLNAFKYVVVPVLKRVLPVAAVGAGIALLVRRLVRRSKSS